MKRLANYSQYFLRRPSLVKELIGHSSLKKTDTVLDIGAGSGVISAVLAQTCAAVLSIEFEPRMQQKLRTNMAKYSNVTVLGGDFLSMPLPIQPYKVFANIPFHLSSPIIRRLTETNTPPRAIYLIVQKQFAQKLLIEARGFTGMLGAMIAPTFSVRIRKRLQRTDFWPHPNVDTVFVEILPRPAPLLPDETMEDYRNFVAKSFSSPIYFATTARAEIGLAESTKPSQMTLAQWLLLYTATQKLHSQRH